MDHSEREYLLARVQWERGLAAKATKNLVCSVHLRLAHEHELRSLGAQTPPRDDNDVLGYASPSLSTRLRQKRSNADCIEGSQRSPKAK